MAPREPWPYHPRDVDGAWRAIEDLRRVVDRMQIADEIAERVADEMRRRTILGASILQKLVAAAIGLVVFAGSVASLIHLVT